MKRPTLDPEINDSTVQLIPNPVKYPLPFSENVDTSYQDWLTELVQNRDTSNYPWTGLGYTYDWSPKSKDNIGLSEFIIGKNADVIVKGFFTTEEYCAVPD